jgi:uncharacterized protein
MLIHLRFICQIFKYSVLTFFIFVNSCAFAQKAVPELWGQRVHDEAHVLKSETVDLLEKKLKTYEDSTSNQIAILIVQSLEGDVLEEYSLRVAEKWKLGRNDKDNGVLLLVAIDDHKMRIEVGHGLEGVLTDAQSNRIIRNEMAPNFRRGDYDAGILAAIDGIIKSIGGEYTADDVSSVDGSSEDSLGEKILIGLFVFGILGLFTVFAIFSSGCAGWGLYAFLIPFYATFPWAIFGYPGALIVLIFYVVATPIAKILVARSKWGKKLILDWKNTKSSARGSGWSSGGSSWGGGWSSGGGGGFSGGGGSFGGGGSSGSW